MLLTFLAIGGTALVLLAVTQLIGDFLDGIFDTIDFSGGYLSSTAVLAFLATFGLVGALAVTSMDLTALPACGVALATGAIVGAGAGVMTKALMNGSTAHQVTTNDYLGRTATITVAIPEAGLGQINFTVAGQTTSLAARATTPVATGTAVTITALLSPGTVQVAPTS